jgi:hypothetical protein
MGDSRRGVVTADFSRIRSGFVQVAAPLVEPSPHRCPLVRAARGLELRDPRRRARAVVAKQDTTPSGPVATATTAHPTCRHSPGSSTTR